MGTKVDKRTKEYKAGLETAKTEIVARIEKNIADGGLVLDESEIVEKPSARPVADLLHCPRCGSELLEDERNSKSPAHCRQCVWRNA